LNSIQTIAIAGTGNVAFHLGKAFKEAGLKITGIYGRNSKKSFELAELLESNVISKPEDLCADLVLICVKDDAIEEVSNLIHSEIFVAHTSGSIGINALGKHKNAGVIYPLQTMSQSLEVDLTKAPFLIEASDTETLKRLAELSACVSEDIHVVNSEDRETLHMAAVMVNNFTNHLVATAKTILDEQGLDWKLLLPLLQETSQKLKYLDPENAQTGPAIRGDQKTIEKHLSKLAKSEQQLYQLFTERIANHTKES
jgi:predicted short-subunit dehydrogenase-like oxidoreductase (DUF2520 family)